MTEWMPLDDDPDLSEKEIDDDDSADPVFFSHPGAFKTTLVMPVARSVFRMSDIDVFLDEWSIKPSEDGWQKILDHVRKCTVFVVFLDHLHFVQSKYCLAELKLALELGKTIFPVFLSSLKDYPKTTEQVRDPPDTWTHEMVVELLQSVLQLNGFRAFDDKNFQDWKVAKSIVNLVRTGVALNEKDFLDKPPIERAQKSREFGVGPASQEECIPEKRQKQAERAEVRRLAERNSRGSNSASDFGLWRLSATLGGVKRIRFYNALDSTVFLWVYHSAEQLNIRKRNINIRPARQNDQLPVQAVQLSSGIAMSIYLQVNRALITFAVLDRSKKLPLAVLQHQRCVPANHKFTFRQYHLSSGPLLRIPYPKQEVGIIRNRSHQDEDGAMYARLVHDDDIAIYGT